MLMLLPAGVKCQSSVSSAGRRRQCRRSKAALDAVCRLMMAAVERSTDHGWPAADVGAADVSPLRSWIVRHPIATFLVLVYATTTALVFVPKGLTEPGLPLAVRHRMGYWRTSSGSAVPAFIVTALVSGKAGVRGSLPGAAC